ncbi:MAG: response regulator transcription factor [Alphaproteobacteria bacterium]|nr:MAG: response regulator transcription factor [Alphaproteobacteria bacterium]
MSASRKILVVQADSDMEPIIVACLRREGCVAVTVSPDAPPSSKAVAAVVVDSVHAAMDGWEICRQWRQEGFSGPILLLALGRKRRQALDDRMRVLTPPVRFPEAIAHLVRDVGLPESTRSPGEWRIGPWRVDKRGRQLVHTGGGRQKLTQKELELLLKLSQSKKAGMTARDLLTEVWGYQPGVTSHTLASHVYRLRRKLGEGLLLRDMDGQYRLSGVQED